MTADRDEVERSANRLTELEQRYERARPSEFGPLSKQMAEERDVLASEIRHPESRRG